ncbi:MAG: HypC/HybG/HupF family hydrogenase formation chaperone [Bacteroidota bacterium]
MCLAVPGKVVSIEEGTQPRMGTVSFGGTLKRICLEWVPEVREGEYVVVHVGFALHTLNEEEARETLRMFREMEEGSADAAQGEGV